MVIRLIIQGEGGRRVKEEERETKRYYRGGEKVQWSRKQKKDQAEA